MKKRSLKIVLHHNIEDSIDVANQKSKHKFWVRIIYGLLNLLAQISYLIGLVIVGVVSLPLTLKKLFVFKDKHFLIQKKKLAIFVLILSVAAAPIVTLSFASESWKVSGRVLGVSDDALLDIASAQKAIANEDYELAQISFTQALTKLKMMQNELNSSSAMIRAASSFAPASFNTDNFLRSATLITESGILASSLMAQVSNLTFTPGGISLPGQDTKTAIIKLTETGLELKSKLTEAEQLLKPINTSFLPAQYQLALNTTKELLADITTKSSQLADMLVLLNDLMLGKKSFLVVLQNNNELRATGGFIGTIAQGKIADGIINDLDIRSVYDLDGQILEWLKPPSPLQAVNSRMFLRDSNWFVSFPESAKRLSVMYEKSGGETPDLIMAFTPELFLDFLRLTGPIELPTYNVVITADNFIEQIQTTTSISYDKKLNQPKQLLADLYPVLMQRLGELSKNDPLLFISILQQNLANKNILLYSRNNSLQSRFEQYNWAGKVLESEGDYLQINSSNLSGSKTDRNLNRSAILSTTVDENGNIINQLTYTVHNPLPAVEGLTNRSWIRILVPDNSKLLGASGFTNFTPADLPTDHAYHISPAISAWESELKFDEPNQVYIGKEAGKQFFANWLEVLGGQTKTISVTYQLPKKLSGQISNYRLLWQKQSGMLSFPVEQRFNFVSRTPQWSNVELQRSNDSSYQWFWQSQLTSDKFTGLVLTK
jgi:hypothetical protein